MASPRAKAGASRSVKFSPSTRRGYTSLPNSTVEHSISQSNLGQNDDLDTPSSGDESIEQANIKLLPLKQGRARDSRLSSPKTNEPNPTINVPDDERDASERIKEILEANGTIPLNSFSTDLEEGHSDRDSLVLSDRYSDDYGIPSDKGLLLNDIKREDVGKGSDWRSLFRLTSWWNVLGLLIIALLVVWFSLRGLGWSSVGAAIGEFVGLSSFSSGHLKTRNQPLTITASGPLVPYSPRRNERTMEGELCQSSENGQRNEPRRKSERYNRNRLANGTLCWQYG